MSHYFPVFAECSRYDIFPGVTTRTCSGEKLMFSFADLAPHSVVTEHSHPHEQMGLVLEGSLRFTIGGEEKILNPGDFFRIPGDVKHKAIVLDKPARVLDVFCPVREDYR